MKRKHLKWNGINRNEGRETRQKGMEQDGMK